MILFRKWAKHKDKSCIYCANQFLCEKRHKKWGQECKQKQSLLFNFCNILIYWSLEPRKEHGDLLFLNLIFTYFPTMNNQENLKKFHGQVSNVSYLHKRNHTSNKTPALKKSMNMDIWVVGTSNQLFIRGS